MTSIELQLCDIQGRLFKLSAQRGISSAEFIKVFMKSATAKALDSTYNRMQWAGEEYLLEEVIDEAGDNYLKEYFKKVYENRPSNFANGRAVRNLFEEVITNQANRLANKSEITDDELNTLTYEDFLVDENEPTGVATIIIEKNTDWGVRYSFCQ